MPRLPGPLGAIPFIVTKPSGLFPGEADAKLPTGHAWRWIYRCAILNNVKTFRGSSPMFVTLKKEFLSQPAGKVIDVTEADGKALIDSGVAEACGNDPLGGVIAKSFEALTGNLTKSLDSL